MGKDVLILNEAGQIGLKAGRDAGIPMPELKSETITNFVR